MAVLPKIEVPVELTLADAEVRRLRLGPTDTVILRLDDLRFSQAAAAEIKTGLQRIFPNNKVVVLAPGAELEVVEEVQA